MAVNDNPQQTTPLLDTSTPQRAAASTDLLQLELNAAKQQLQKSYPRYDEVSLTLVERQTLLSDTTHTLDPQRSADLEQQCLALKAEQQQLVANDKQLAALVHDIAHLEALQTSKEKTWLNKLDHYNEMVGNTTFETVQDANLAATFSQLASQFIYPLPIVGAAVLSCVELVNVLKAAAFDKETQNRRAVKQACRYPRD